MEQDGQCDQPIEAFVEVLSGIVRAGPGCNAYGKPYDYAIAFSSADGRHAVIKALVGDGKISLAHYRALVRVLKAQGLKPIWERIPP